MSLDLPAADLPAPFSGGLPPMADTGALSRREKAAIIVRCIVAEGTTLNLNTLPEDRQEKLAYQLARMGKIEQSTVDAVIDEFVNEIEQSGLSFPQALDDALGMLDGIISPATAALMREREGLGAAGDPWQRLDKIDNERFIAILDRESTEVASIILSKLQVSKAADILGMLPGEKARRITYAISQTTAIAPATVKRIGQSLIDELSRRPIAAFDEGPVARVGAILNYSRAATRDDVLEGLDVEDKEFADEVRAAIFTFENIPDRVADRDVPRIQRDLEQDDIILAVAGAEGKEVDAIDFILSNISKRLAEGIREEAKEKKAVDRVDVEAAMGRIVSTIRELEAAGEIFLTIKDG